MINPGGPGESGVAAAADIVEALPARSVTVESGIYLSTGVKDALAETDTVTTVSTADGPLWRLDDEQR